MSKKFVSLSALVLGAALIMGGCGTKAESNSGEQAGSAAGSQSSENSAGSVKNWASKPEMAIDTSKNYQAVFKTSDGEFTVTLFAKDAPETVNNFVFLVQQKFYDGIVFHRIMETFMIQSGDPTGTGSGGPGYTIPDELNNGHTYKKGTIAMANTGQSNSGGSQFFIGTGSDVESLDKNPIYSIFGEVTSGMDIIDKIASTPVKASEYTGEMSTPVEPVKIESIEIKES